MRRVKSNVTNAFLLTVLVAGLLASCVGADEDSAKNVSTFDAPEDCEADRCNDIAATTLYRRAFFVCGFEPAYGEPLPTISALSVADNIRGGVLIGGKLEAVQAEGDPFRGYSQKLDCLDPSFRNVSLVEVFETGPNGETGGKIGKGFFDEKLNGLKLKSTDNPWRGCVVETYMKPFSEGLARQAFVLARHTEFDRSNGIRCSAAAHFILGGVDISDGVENHMELRGPLKTRFRFLIK